MPDQPDQNAPPLVVVSDGYVYSDYLALCGRDMEWLEGIAALKKQIAHRDDVTVPPKS